MSFADAGPISLEKQLVQLAAAGIRPRQDVTPAVLTALFERDQYESAPYRLLLAVLGGDHPQPPHHPLSDDIWLLDTECVEGPGSYAEVVRRLQALAKGDLPLEKPSDYFGPTETWLSFRLDGRVYRWQAQMDDAWIDGQVLSAFAQLLRTRGSARRFTYSNLGGQECLIGCATPEQLDALNALGGPRFVWLA